MTWPIVAILLFLGLFALLSMTVFTRRDEHSEQLSLAYYQDGLWDIYLGLLLLLLGVAEWLEASWAGLIPVLLYPLLLTTKRAITEPRLNPEEVPPTGQTQRNKLLSVALVSVILLFGVLLVLLLVMQIPAWLELLLQSYLMTALLLLVAAGFAILGWQTGVTRLIVYAGLFLAALLVSYWVEIPLFVYGLTLGSIILVSGLALTVQFVQHHPKLV